MSKLIIYIAGYGRSGSTVLDLALSATCRQAVSLGEVGSLISAVRRPRLGCSCGEPYHQCPIWRHEAGMVDLMAARGDAVRVSSLDGFRGFFRKPDEAYLEFWQGVLDRRLNSGLIQPSKNTVLIDSTKTTIATFLRPRNLAYLKGYQVVVVHLKRDLRGVLLSRRKGRNVELGGRSDRLTMVEKILGILWPVVVPLHWLASNLAAFHLRNSSQVLLGVNLSFSDLARNPEEAAVAIWRRVEMKTGYVLSVEKTASGKAYPHHLVEGNRLLRKSEGVDISGRHGRENNG